MPRMNLSKLAWLRSVMRFSFRDIDPAKAVFNSLQPGEVVSTR
jgi:hypothetical protein